MICKRISGGDKEVHIFPKGISPKNNVMARLEFELADVCFSLQGNALDKSSNSLLTVL